MAMTQPSETQERLKQIREQRVEAAKRSWMDFPPQPTWKDIDFLLSLIDTRAPVDSQGAGDGTFAAAHFTFGPCAHSMVKPDCPSCCQSHAIRMEQQLSKLEASTALPERERIEKALREHVTHCYQVYKSVPPTVADWVGGALHYVMWGLDRDVPLAPDAATQMRTLCVEKVREYGKSHALCHPLRARAAIELVPMLESLTLDQVKQEKESK